MALKLATSVRNSRGNVIVAALDAGAGPGTIKFYTAPQPATGAALTTQTLIGTCVLSDPSATVASGIITFNPVSDDVLADATGTIAWARFEDSASGFVADGDCGTTGSGAAIIFNTLAAQAGGIVRILSAILTEGNGG